MTTIKICPICGEEYTAENANTCTLDGAEASCCASCAGGNYATCDDCGGVTPTGDCCTTHDGRNICPDCADDYAYCDDCGELYPLDYLERVNPGAYGERYICPGCLDAYTRCDCCGGYYSRERIWAEDDYRAICDDCCYDYYVCNDCGAIVDADDAYTGDDGETYCNECIDDHRGARHDYSYKPYPDPHRLDTEDRTALLYGVELETDHGDDPDGLARKLDRLGLPIYCKHDGSLDDGVEIVTHPATLAYHMARMRWDVITAYALRDNAESHNAGTCGLHVHVGRAQLRTATRDSGDVADALTVLCCALHAPLTVLSRRSESTMQRWSAWNMTVYDLLPCDDDDAVRSALLTRLMHSDGRGRYQAVNRQNCDTVELRIFRGTLKLTTIYATLQLVDTLVKYAQTHDMLACMRTTWADFTATIPANYVYIRNYIRDRGLSLPE